jgi:hypothetical protein
MLPLIHEHRAAANTHDSDGKTIVTASNDGTARLWLSGKRRPIDEIARDVASRVGRALTDDERRRFGLEPVQAQ